MRPFPKWLAMMFSATLGWLADPMAAQNSFPACDNVAANVGIAFTHRNGATPEKYMPETMGAGGLFFDNDGNLDLLVVNNGQAVDLLRNSGGNSGNALLIRTVGTKSNRDGVGARLTLTVGDRALVRHVKAGSSYLAQSGLRIHFGLGDATGADRLRIAWPSGQVDLIEGLEANQILTVVEGQGIRDRTPINR